MLEDINQNDKLSLSKKIMKEIEYIFENKPINRIITKPKVEDKIDLLEKLKTKIQNIDNCELKSQAKKLVFSDGNPNSELMIVGEGPGEKEDQMGKPFVCLLYTSPSPRDKRQSRMPSSA